MEQDKNYAMYCKPRHEYVDPSWLVIFEPFDLGIWICLSLSAIMFAILYKNIAYAFDLFFVLIAQQNQKKWNRCAGILFLLLSILNQEYQCEETTKVTAPLSRQEIQTLVELFGNGYKFVLPDMNAAVYGESLMGDRLSKLGITGSETVVINGTLLDLNDGIQWYWYLHMASFKWIIPVGKMIYLGKFKNRQFEIFSLLILIHI